MNQAKKNDVVVVTGGAGFIGSHTVGKFLNRGDHVIVLDNFSTGKRSNLSEWKNHDKLTVLEADIANNIWPALENMTRKHGSIDKIIHLAAQTAVINSINDPIGDVRMNYTTTVNVLEYAKHTGVKSFVYASSAAIYGDTEKIPITEDTRCQPVSPYGINKYGSEYYMYYYAKLFGLSTTSLRFFNVYGPRQDPQNAYSGVISIFLERAFNNKKITIFGDGKQTRDFVYVGDVADAIVACSDKKNSLGEYYNIGTSTEIDINQLAQFTIKATQSESTISYESARSGEILRSKSEIKKASEAFGYKPKVDIETGLQKTAEWYKETFSKT